MPAKYTTLIAWPSQEEREEAKRKAAKAKWSLSNLVRKAIKAYRIPRKK